MFLEGVFAFTRSLLRLLWRWTGAGWLPHRIASELAESRAGQAVRKALASRVGVNITAIAAKRLTPRAIGGFLFYVFVGPPYPERRTNRHRCPTCQPR
jgi:hypothetical protein